jgi:hypothetical protein
MIPQGDSLATGNDNLRIGDIGDIGKCRSDASTGFLDKANGHGVFGDKRAA